MLRNDSNEKFKSTMTTKQKTKQQKKWCKNVVVIAIFISLSLTADSHFAALHMCWRHWIALSSSSPLLSPHFCVVQVCSLTNWEYSKKASFALTYSQQTAKKLSKYKNKINEISNQHKTWTHLINWHYKKVNHIGVCVSIKAWNRAIIHITISS